MALNPSTLAAFVGRITAADSDYPYGSSKNESAPGAGDGTPYLKARADDIFGFQQALLRSSGLVPNGNADTAPSSQYLQSIVQQVQGRATLFNDGGVADAYILQIRSNQQAPGALFEGQEFKILAGNSNSGASTLDVSAAKGEAPGTTVLDVKLKGGTIDPSAGQISAGETFRVIYRTSPSPFVELQIVEIQTAIIPFLAAPALRTIIENDAGDPDHDILFNPGKQVSASGETVIVLGAPIVKRLDASWLSGTNQGGLFSGAVANFTWYHCFLIVKDSDGTVDAGFDTDLNAANIPSGYTAYKRVGSIKTDGSANVLGFRQYGDYFEWDVQTQDVNTNSQSTASILYTLTVPLGINVVAICTAGCASAGNNAAIRIRNPDANDVAIVADTVSNNAGTYTFGVATGDTIDNNSGQFSVSTNKSSQVAVRASGAFGVFSLGVVGWEDKEL